MFIPNESWIALIVAVFTAIGLIIGSLFNWWSLKASKESLKANIASLEQSNSERYVNIILTFGQQLDNQIANEPKLKTLADCEIYVINYLHVLNQIVYLKNVNKIPQELTSYFQDFFEYAKPMIEWYDTVFPKSRKAEERWPEVYKWKTKELYDNTELPDQMREFYRVKTEQK
jgi:hypothetical protein